MIADEVHLEIGLLAFDGLDQIDLTGPFEVLAPAAERDHPHLRQVARAGARREGAAPAAGCNSSEAPQLDVLHVPGGYGQEALMDDEETLDWVRRQAAGARCVLSVCTGALICGAAGLLKGKRATTHWSAFHLLPLFGAAPVDERVVIDGNLVSAAGVTAGIDGALRLAAMLRGDNAARAIQLYLQYAPEPPFDSGTPERAPPAILAAARRYGR